MTDNGNANTIGDLFRSLGGVLNTAVYFLLGIMYQIFFNVASAELFSSQTIKNFYGRIQLIIGVFMVFKLTVSILQGIINPDQFVNPKDGFGSIISRVVVALVLLTVLVPINVPNVENANSFEKYINNNGILFGTLYSLQDRILSNNTIGRLILGTTDTAVDSGSDADETESAKLQRSSRVFASTILKGFLRINLKPAEMREDDLETNQDNWYCGANLDSNDQTIIEAYQQLDIDPSSLLSGEVITADCPINNNILDAAGNMLTNVPVFGGLFGIFAGNSRYLFAFNWVMAFVVGAVFLVLLVLFTIDIAVRSLKLAVLRLIAPIPIISYIDPKSSKDGGMFSSWVKSLTSTYLDLFLRLAIIYFVIFLIQDMIENGIVINEASGMVGIMSFIFIMLGLFFFAKMAPKFIKDVLGIKGGSMTNIGLSGALAAAGAVRQGGTLFEAGEAVMDATRMQTEAYNQGKPAPGLGLSYNSGRDHVAKILTGDQNMSGRRMSRGSHHLSRMGITTPYAEQVKQDMYDAEDFAAAAKDQYDRFNQGYLTDNELTSLQRDLKDETAAYEARGYKHNEAFRRALQDRMFQAQADAGRAKSTYGKIEGMQKLYGQARSYEAQFDGKDGKYTARNFRNRALGSGGRSFRSSSVQQWRTQKFPAPGNPNPEATSSTNPTQAGVDFTAPGSMGEGGGFDDGPGGPPPR